MPRYRRLFLTGYPHHIVQRGHDRHAVFAEDRDYQVYLKNFREQLRELGIGLLSYCLMTNHVHLLIVPRREGDDLSRMMRVLAARQTRYVNRVEQRSGTLWEGRFKCSVVHSEQYLLACCRYIEMNPVRAGLVDYPEAYRWSSYQDRVGIRPPSFPLEPHPLMLGVSVREEERVRHYRAYVLQGIPAPELDLIRNAVRRNQLTGSASFRTQIEQKLGRRLSDRAQGRPRRPDGRVVYADS